MKLNTLPLLGIGIIIGVIIGSLIPFKTILWLGVAWIVFGVLHSGYKKYIKKN